MGPEAFVNPPPETFALRGRAGLVALDARGIHHPRAPRGGGFVRTPYEELVHVACSPRALWLGARRSTYVLPRRLFQDADAPERLCRAVFARIAERPGGHAQLARLAEIERVSQREAPTRATHGLALLCLVVFALHLLLGRDVEDVGYFKAALVADGDWWRIFTANLLHAFPRVPVHLVLNLIGLVALGTLAERPLGLVRTLLVMGASGVAAMAASGVAGHPRVVGVSGVVFGLLGGVTWLELRMADRLPAWWRVPRRPLFAMIAFSALVPLLVPVIAGAAHLGGFLAGALVTALCFRGLEPAPASLPLRAAAAAVVAVTALALCVSAAELARPGAYAPELIARLARLPDIPAGELNNEAWVIAIDPDSSTEMLAGALAMAERAADETGREVPTVLDTLAEVQFQLGWSEAAVETIEEAIARQPFEPYYREQLRRFLGERDPDDRPSPPVVETPPRVPSAPEEEPGIRV